MGYKLKYLAILLLVSFQSCSMCSSKKMNTSVVSNDSVSVVEGEYREPWSSRSDIGYPIIADTIPSLLLERYCYSVSYNKFTRKDGVWNEYREDSELPSEIRSTLEDYASSGYDRGHMCPGGDCNWDDEGRDETFLLSNMCPQNPNLNRGDWKEIEIACRKWAKQYDNIYIVCGPLFFKRQEHEKIGPHKVPVPEAFFKVVLCIEPSTPKGIGFICRNTDGNRKKDFYVNSIRQVERVTGYRFFPNLEDSIKSVVYDMDDINIW